MTGRLGQLINLPGIAVIATAVMLWEIACGSRLLDYQYLPAPSAVLNGFRAAWEQGVVVSALVHTLAVTFVAALIAISGGVVIGGAVALSPSFRTYTAGSIDVLRTLPVVALVPVAVLVWGPVVRAEIVLAVYSSIWPVLVNSAGGFRNVHPRLTEVARSFRFSRWNLCRKVILPAALPAILIGARLAVIHALVVAIVAELIIYPRGIGGAIQQAQQALQPEQLWAWLVISGCLGYALNGLLVAAAHRALPGQAVKLRAVGSAR